MSDLKFIYRKVTNVAIGELHVKGEPDINKAKVL